MKDSRRSPRLSWCLPLVLVLASTPGAPLLWAAVPDTETPPEVVIETTEDEAPPPQQPTPRDQKRLAKEARIAEYLRKREERRAMRESGVAAGQEAPAERPAVVQQRPDRQPSETAASEPGSRPERPAHGRVSRLPRNLARAQENIRSTPLGLDPTVQVYLDRIDRQEASAEQLAAFGNFLAENGLARDALQYYDIALNLQPRDSLLWTNAGTLHRQVGDVGAALSAYYRALSINPNNAMAHYNVGALLDSQGKYEESLEEYKIALSLDPTLGDPAYNPQAANNERLLAVKLLLYHEQAGSLGLPLSEVPGGQLQEAEAQEEPEE